MTEAEAATQCSNWLETIFTLNTPCMAYELTPIFTEWEVQLFILLPAFLFLIKLLIHALLSMGVPMPFASERIKQYTKESPKLSLTDEATIKQLSKTGRLAANLMQKVDNWLAWVGGSPIFSLASYQRVLLFAFAYPILTMLTIWLFTNQGQLADHELMPELAFFERLYIYSLIVVPSIYSYFALKNIKEWGATIQAKFLKYIQIDTNSEELFTILCVPVVAVFMALLGKGTLASLAAIASSIIGYAVASSYIKTRFIVVPGVMRRTFAMAIAIPISGFVFSLTGVVDSNEAMTATIIATFMFVLMGLLIFLIDKDIRTGRFWPVILALLSYAVMITVLIYIPPHSTFFINLTTQIQTNAFVICVLMVCLPVVNALSDWLSVSFTRYLFSCYQKTNSQQLPWHLIVADFALTLILCLALYHAVLGLLYAMQQVGWPSINVKEIITAFNKNPMGAKSSWLTLLVVTNFIPLLLHYGAFIVGIWQRRWQPPHIKGYVKSLNNNQALSQTDARILAMFLTWDRYLNVAVMVLLIPSMYLLMQWLLHWSLKFWQ